MSSSTITMASSAGLEPGMVISMRLRKMDRWSRVLRWIGYEDRFEVQYFGIVAVASPTVAETARHDLRNALPGAPP